MIVRKPRRQAPIAADTDCVAAPTKVNPPPRSRQLKPAPPPPAEAPPPPNRTSDGDYIVGKNRPPLGSRWPPGQSGNPKGSKKKGLADLEALTLDLMEKKVTLSTSRGPETMTQGQAFIRKLFEKAMKGDHKAAQLLVEMQRRGIERRAKVGDDEDALSAADQALFEALLAAQTEYRQQGLGDKP